MKEETNKYKQIIVTPFSWSSKWFECQRFVTTPETTSQLYLLVKHMIQKSSYYECQQQSQTAYPWIYYITILTWLTSNLLYNHSVHGTWWYLQETSRARMWHTTDVQLGSVLAATKQHTSWRRGETKKALVPKGPKCWDHNLGTWFPMFFFWPPVES